MPKTYLNPSELFPSQQYGFSHIVVLRGGATVYISGQVGWDAKESASRHLPTQSSSSRSKLWP